MNHVAVKILDRIDRPVARHAAADVVAQAVVALHGPAHAGAAWLHAHDQLDRRAQPDTAAASATLARIARSYDPLLLDPDQTLLASVDIPAWTPDAPDEIAIQADTRRHVATALRTLSAREERVLRMRFGIGGSDRLFVGDYDTLESIGSSFAVNRERIRQIEAKALRKLKHPSRGRPLRTILGYGEWTASKPQPDPRSAKPAASSAAARPDVGLGAVARPPEARTPKTVSSAMQALLGMAEATSGRTVRREKPSSPPIPADFIPSAFSGFGPTRDAAEAVIEVSRHTPRLRVDLVIDPPTRRHQIVASVPGRRSDYDGPSILGNEFLDTATIRSEAVRLLHDLQTFDFFTRP